MIDCDFDGQFVDYRECLRVSDGTVRCCESGWKIPAGFVYAECQGRLRDEYFEAFPQALEVWRYLRNQSALNGHCRPFGGVEEIVGRNDFDDDKDKMFAVGWRRTCKMVQKRFAEGKKARLHPWEKAALESGEWFDWIQYPSGGRRFPSGSVTYPSSFAGEPWVPVEHDDELEDGL